MQMTIYDAATVGSRSNCVYPNPVTVTDAGHHAGRRRPSTMCVRHISRITAVWTTS